MAETQFKNVCVWDETGTNQELWRAKNRKGKGRDFSSGTFCKFLPSLSLSLSLYSSLQAGLIIRLSSYSGEATQMGGGLHKGLHKRRCEKEEIERETPN